MAKIKFILDPRPRKDGTSSLLLFFSQNQFRRKIKLNISLNSKFWNAEKEEVISKFPQGRQINQQINYYRAAADRVFLKNMGEMVIK